MPKPPSGNVAAVKQYLQKCIKQLLSALLVLQECEKNSEKIIGLLANLLEQRECSERVDKGNLMLYAQFPDLKERLCSKLSNEVDHQVTALRDCLQPLKEGKELLCQSKEDLFPMVFSLNLGHVDVAAIHGTPTVPPLGDILEWVDVAERQIRQVYCARIFYLEDVAEQNVVNSENLISLWKEDAHRVVTTFTDCQRHLKYFLEEKS